MRKKLIPLIVICGVISVTTLAAIDEHFTLSLPGIAPMLNPVKSSSALEAQVYTAIYEGLVSYDPKTLQPIPAVAERWEISNQGTTYRFFLRPDARYWNGDQVTADHFRATWLLLLAQKTEAPYSFLFDPIHGAKDYRQGLGSAEDVGIIAETNTILRVELDEPATHFLIALCHHSFYPLHPRLLKINDSQWNDIDITLGNGPYFILESTEKEMQLERSKYYWDNEQVAIERLSIRFSDDAQRNTELFNNGSVNWIAGDFIPSEVSIPETIVTNRLFATTYLYVRADHRPWNILPVRRAMALLLPWEQIRSREIITSPTHTIIPNIPRYAPQEGIQQQEVDEALRLLRSEGYPRGEGFDDIIIKIPVSETYLTIAELIRDSWQEHLSVTVRIEQFEPYSEYYLELEKDDYTIGLQSWIGDYADPLTFLHLWTSDSNLNYARYSDEDYDRTIKNSLSQQGEERYTTLGRAEKMILSGGLIMPLRHSGAANVIDLDIIGGWYPNPIDLHPFKHLFFKLEAGARGTI